MFSFLFYPIVNEKVLTTKYIYYILIQYKRDNFLGDDNEEGTPVPIPNTAVKLFDAENT